MADTPRLTTVLARLVGIPESMPDDDKADDLATELALTLDSFGLDADGIDSLALAWEAQLDALLVGVREELSTLAATREREAADRRARGAQQAAATRKADDAARSIFDNADTPHDWLGQSHDLPDTDDDGGADA
jgi:hypothetical protein